jgi:hypothetical protein
MWDILQSRVRKHGQQSLPEAFHIYQISRRKTSHQLAALNYIPIGGKIPSLNWK